SYEKEIVAPHAHTAVANMGAALRLPEVVPQLVAIVGVERPRVVGRCHVEDAVHAEDGTFDLRGPGDGDAAIDLAGNDTLWIARATRSVRARPVGQAAHPGEREVLDVRLVDLRQRAVAAAGVIA